MFECKYKGVRLERDNKDIEKLPLTSPFSSTGDTPILL